MADLNFYDIAIPPFLRQLDNLEAFLKKGRQWAKDNGKSDEDLLTLRLAPDMHPLASQIQRLSDSMRFVPVRVGKGVAPVAIADDEKTFDDLYARIAKTREFLEAVPKTAFDGVKVGDEVVWQMPSGERRLPALGYLMGFALPNVAFHVTIAYAILRHAGAPVGKLDYLGATRGGVGASEQK